MAKVALPVPCVPISTIEALESNTRRHSWSATKDAGVGVDLLLLGRLRCFSEGGDGVGSGFRPSSSLMSSAFIAAYVLFVPIVVDVMVGCTFRVFFVVLHPQAMVTKHCAVMKQMRNNSYPGHLEANPISPRATPTSPLFPGRFLGNSYYTHAMASRFCAATC